MEQYQDYRIFRTVSNSQTAKFTESKIISVRSLQEARQFAREWAFDLVEYHAEPYTEPETQPVIDAR